jgi:HJR/Mrr/RecB family endonuclease
VTPCIDFHGITCSGISQENEKRKSKKQKLMEKGRRAYRKGENFEKKAYPFLARKGFKVTKSRVRSKRREEFNGLATDKHGHTHGVEVKATKQKVSVAVVRKLKKKLARNKLLHGGIIVSQKGFTKSAEREAQKSGIKTFKYKQKRRKSDSWW